MNRNHTFQVGYFSLYSLSRSLFKLHLSLIKGAKVLFIEDLLMPSDQYWFTDITDRNTQCARPSRDHLVEHQTGLYLISRTKTNKQFVYFKKDKFINFRYGDIHPQSGPGYFVGAVCTIAGMLATGLPIPIIASNFNHYYSFARYFSLKVW